MSDAETLNKYLKELFAILNLIQKNIKKILRLGSLATIFLTFKCRVDKLSGNLLLTRIGHIFKKPR